MDEAIRIKDVIIISVGGGWISLLLVVVLGISVGQLALVMSRPIDRVTLKRDGSSLAERYTDCTLPPPLPPPHALSVAPPLLLLSQQRGFFGVVASCVVAAQAAQAATAASRPLPHVCVCVRATGRQPRQISRGPWPGTGGGSM